MGTSLCIAEDGYQAFYLLLHMLQHFLRGGFGLKLLCDWVVFWDSGIENSQKQIFLRLVTQCEILQYTRVLTAVCVHYLGLNCKEVEFLKVHEIEQRLVEEFLRETFDSEEFGGGEAQRMVVLRDTSLVSYVREFHHQLCLSNPE